MDSFSYKSVKEDHTANEIGVWQKDVLVNGRHISMMIVRESTNKYRVANATDIKLLGQTETLEDATELANNYLTHNLTVIQNGGGSRIVLR